MYAIMAWVFKFGIFWVLFRVNRCVFLPLVLLRVLLFSHDPILLFDHVLFVPIFFTNLFCFLIFGMSTCRIFSLFWYVLFCLYCFTLSHYVLNLPSFVSSFRFISLSCFVCFTCVAFSFLSQHVPAFFLWFIIFACCRFFICISGRISHPGFEFLFLFFGEPRFFRRLNLILHKLVRLVPWC